MDHPSGSSLSPLELLMQQGRQEAPLYQRATALSRRTSVRRSPIPDPDPDAQLLSNAFRNSVASDISFNSITGAEAESLYTSSSLGRRDSVDTVRTAEFGADGKWGRAWATRADDEESAYGDDEDDRLSLSNLSLEPQPGSHLDDIARRWKQDYTEQPQIHHGQAREHVVNLTRTESAPPRQSQVPNLQTQTMSRHRSTDSSSTIGAGARVYVYPPSPSGSEPKAYRHDAIPQSSQAVVQHAGPVAPSQLLSQPHSPILGRRPNRSGHPAGRLPPPAPTQGGYDDPNRPTASPRPALGQMRTQAIAAADGRESIVSDLDVETLRLDSSSRRDSSSTIASRMSIGTVHYPDPALSPPPETRPPPRPAPPAAAPSSAEDFLSQGITYHEQGDLSRSAFYFERSAKVDGGCVVGMCMFGMALREGWGARKDPRKGFEWIQKAAARAGELMQSPKSPAELKAIKSELKLSVYELAKCFCYGWGVKMDKAMALEYFELAAKLGDADAQAEAGALYASGKGCKKDLKKAAMYYRMAEEGGYDTVGLSWIHKDKYK